MVCVIKHKNISRRIIMNTLKLKKLILITSLIISSSIKAEKVKTESPNIAFALVYHANNFMFNECLKTSDESSSSKINEINLPYNPYKGCQGGTCAKNIAWTCETFDIYASYSANYIKVKDNKKEIVELFNRVKTEGMSEAYTTYRDIFLKCLVENLIDANTLKARECALGYKNIAEEKNNKQALDLIHLIYSL